MIDFIRTKNLHIDSSQLLGNDLLSFPMLVMPKTGEVLDKNRYSVYRGMKFIITPKGFTGMRGSLHKYFNYGTHNHNDFNIDNIISVVYDLNQNFNIDPRSVVLNNIEIGVNIEIPYCPDDFIDNLVTHKHTRFSVERDTNMTIANVKAQQFQIKIYNKSLQYCLDKNILRFEVKVLRMALLKKYGIHVLWDLMDLDKLNALRVLLLEAFGNLAYWDESIELDSLPERDREFLRNGRNPKFWKENLTLSGSNASKNFRKFQDLVRNYGKNHYHEIGDLINKKWDSLLNLSVEGRQLLTKFQKELDEQEIRELTEFQEEPINGDKRILTENNYKQETEDIRVLTEKLVSEKVETTGYETRPSHSLITSINNLNIGGKVVFLNNNKRTCPVTGLDISMQKAASRFLSTIGIKYYLDKHPEIFKKLQDRLTDTWANNPLEKRIFEIAHSIRNAHHSKRIHTKKAIKRLCSTPSLFNNYDLISQQKKNVANQA